MRRPRTARRHLLLAVPLAALLSFAVILPAQADPTATPMSGPVTHPESDHMGSTIRAHESPATMPGMVRAAAVNLPPGQPLGLDVSNYQPNINWGNTVANGAKFAYTKATEGTTFIDGSFGAHYTDSSNAGLVRGAYHFALPDRSSGAAQANFFVNNGGGWSADGQTLPPMLDIEYNPYGESCYGMAGPRMASWIRDFSNTVRARTGRYPTIYSTANWWNTCTGSDPSFGVTNPLFLACYCSTPGKMPAGWGYQTIWQYNDNGIFPGDQDVFNGSLDQLRTFAAVADGAPPVTTPSVLTGTAEVIPGAAEAGGVVGVVLNGWAPNTALTVTVDGNGRTYPTVTDAQGSSTVLINVAVDTSVGAHTVVARTATKTASGTFQVIPMAPGSFYQLLSAVLRFLFGI